MSDTGDDGGQRANGGQRSDSQQGASDEQGVDAEQRANSEQGGRPCPLCGEPLYSRHCKYVCPQHGVVYDCSDTFY